MGQVISSADRARRGRKECLRQAIQAQIGDKPNAIPSLQFLGHTMKWYKLDDTVVGGMSLTSHSSSIDGDELHFAGRIDIHGGYGFCSIRSTIENCLPADTVAIRLRYVGDGKTYKILLSTVFKSSLALGQNRTGTTFQVDLPTKSGVEDSVTLNLDSFIALKKEDATTMPITKIEEFGFMLASKLSNGEINPVETFGTDSFPFRLRIMSIEAIRASDAGSTTEMN
jgi:hypothetical protein